MIKKEFILTGGDLNLTSVLKEIECNKLRFDFRTGFRNTGDFILRLKLNISPDMVSEVEELIMEIAEKSGVKVE